MNADIELDTVETHAAGEPGRIVLNAASLVRGDTMPERLDWSRQRLDHLRGLLLHEPRGYPALCAVLVLPPVSEGSDFGMIVLEQGGFTPMSGSNAICAVTAVLETGVVRLRRNETELVIDTAVGAVHATANMEGNKVRSVTVANVPAYVVRLDLILEVPEIGAIPVDVVFGGQFFVQAKATDCGVTLDPAHARQIARAGALIRLAALEQVRVQHPLYPAISGISLVMLHTGDRREGIQAANTVFLPTGPILRDVPSTWTGVLDRSPCGTGTSARMAALYARGQLAIGEDFSHRSIIGSEFIGRLTGTTTVGNLPAVLPTITGSAWITGRSRWVRDATDPFPSGYTLGDIWSPEHSPQVVGPL